MNVQKIPQCKCTVQEVIEGDKLEPGEESDNEEVDNVIPIEQVAI